MKNIAVITSGGDAPGINSVFSGMLNTARNVKTRCGITRTVAIPAPICFVESTAEVFAPPQYFVE